MIKNARPLWLQGRVMQHYQIEPIGYIQSPYKQKFAIPRQPRLIPEAKAKLIF